MGGIPQVLEAGDWFITHVYLFLFFSITLLFPEFFSPSIFLVEMSCSAACTLTVNNRHFISSDCCEVQAKCLQ